MEQASKAVHRWKNRSWVERRRTLGTERDLYQAKFRKNVTVLGLHRPATSNAITRKWHLVPVSNSGHLRRLSCSASWMACPCLRPLAAPRPVNAETTVVSMTTCLPPQNGRLLAMTSILRWSSACATTLRSRSNWFSFTRALASRKIRAMHTSAGVPRGFRRPTREHADLW